MARLPSVSNFLEYTRLEADAPATIRDANINLFIVNIDIHYDNY